MQKFLSSWLTILFLISQAGCASIVSGKTQDISIRSNPLGATVTIDGMSAGATPVTTDVKRKRRHNIKITKEGYVEETRATHKGFNWWYCANLIIPFGIIGLVVDVATGAIFTVSPDEVNVTLTKA